MKKIIAMLMALVMVLALCACGQQAAPAASAPAAAPAAEAPAAEAPAAEAPAAEAPAAEANSKYGGTLIVSQIGQQYEDNYYPPQAANADILQNIRPCLEPLFEVASDGTIIPFLVESYEVQESGKVYIFNIRQGVTFHDGTAFNAEAVKWNIEQTQAAGIHTVYASVESMEVVDEYTLKINLSNADLFFLTTLSCSQASYMVSPSAVQANGEEWAITHPVGTGPFVMESWEYGVETVFTRNENYWGVDEEGNQLPYLDGINFKFVPEEVSVTTSFENGEIDMLRHLSTVALAELEPDFNTTVYAYPSGAFYLWFPTNIDGSAFQDLKVRQAVSYALDMPTIISSLYGSEFFAVNQLSYPGSILWDDTIEGYEYNPEKAKELLAEAGYPNGLKTSIIIENNEQNSALCETMKSYLADVGIDMEIDLADSARYAQTVIFSSWGDQLAIVPFNYSPDEICSMLRMLDPETSLFAHTVRYPDNYKALIKQIATAASLEEAQDLYLQIDKVLIDETCLCVPVYCSNYAIACQDYVHGTGSGSDGETQIRFWSPELVWLDK